MLGDSFDIFVKVSENKTDSACAGDPCYVGIFSRYKNKLFEDASS
jgi:hypothetical protein